MHEASPTYLMNLDGMDMSFLERVVQHKTFMVPATALCQGGARLSWAPLPGCVYPTSLRPSYAASGAGSGPGVGSGSGSAFASSATASFGFNSGAASASSATVSFSPTASSAPDSAGAASSTSASSAAASSASSCSSTGNSARVARTNLGSGSVVLSHISSKPNAVTQAHVPARNHCNLRQTACQPPRASSAGYVRKNTVVTR
jgi:hypothetical protein